MVFRDKTPRYFLRLYPDGRGRNYAYGIHQYLHPSPARPFL